MTRYYVRCLLIIAVALCTAALAAPAFGQTTDNSTWNGGTGFWTVSSEWTTNGQLAVTYPNNTASNVFNVTIDSGQQDIVMLAGPPAITINSLTLDGNPNFSSTLEIGENGGAAGMLTIGSNSSAASLVVNSMGNLDVNAQSELLLNIAAGNGTVTNNGIINVGSASGTGTLAISGGGNVNFLSLNGAGTLTMQPSSVIQGVSGDEVFANQSTIQGSGTISNLALINNGTIIANGTSPMNITPNSGGLNNAGTVTVDSGSTLVLDTTAATNGGFDGLLNSGTIGVLDGGTLQFKDSSTSGNDVRLVNNGAIDVGGSGVGGTLQFNGSNATFDLGPKGAPTGTLTLSDNANNLVTGVTGTETLINDVGETLSGAGTITTLGVWNEGTIIANGTTPLIISALPNQNGEGFQNSAFVQVNAGSTLDLNASGATTAANQIFNSRTITVNDGGTLEFSGSAGQFVKVLNSLGSPAAIDIGGSGAGGTLELNGSNAIFDVYGSGGLLTLSDNANNLITGVTGTETFVNDTGQTLSGAGTISNLALVNNGTIIADGTNALDIVPNASTFVNNGTLQANSGSTLVIDTTAATNAHAPFGGFLSKGTAAAQDGGTLEFSDESGGEAVLGNFGGGALIVGGAGAGGTLEFDGANAQFDLTNEGSNEGGGTLTLSDNANNLITGVTGTETFINDTGETLSGAGTITNLELANNGTIVANGTNALNIKPNSLGFTNNGTVQVNAGSTLNSSGVYTQDAGQTDVNGTLIASSLTIKGGTLASGGGIVETPSLTNGTSITADSTGFIGVGSGKFTATTGYQQLADGTLVELISGASTFGTIDVTGPASLDGTLEVTLENGFIPTVGEQFAFLDFAPGDPTGTFADFLDQTFDNGLGKWMLTYNDASGDIFLTAEANTTSPTPEPASLLLLGTGLLGLAALIRKQALAVRG